MTRYKLTIEYDGRFFCGWQKQGRGLISVQGALEGAVCAFLGGQHISSIQGAGRTDSGVHALAQVAHVDLPVDFPEVCPSQLQRGLNFHLRAFCPVGSAAVIHTEKVSQDFHARFSARSRRYLYRLIHRRSPLALEYGRAWHMPHDLDEPLMKEGTRLLVGHHNFNAFRSIRCQAPSPVKTLSLLEIVREGSVILIHAEAPSFLHNQVRILVGTLVALGKHRRTLEDIRQALLSGNRNKAGPTAPPEGLYFAGVSYDSFDALCLLSSSPPLSTQTTEGE